MAVLRQFWRTFLIMLAAIAGLGIGFAITYLTFENQSQQIQTAWTFLILVLIFGGLYVLKKKRSAKDVPNQEL